MAERLTVEDRLDIQEVIARYAWSLDTVDAEAFAACFAPDGTLVWDTFEIPDRWQGTEALRSFAAFLATRPGAAGRQHHVQNILIEGDRDEARSRSYCIVTDRKGEPPFPTAFAGWYEDVLVRVDGAWKFKERWIRDWSGPVLKRFAGQTGERVPRRRPDELQRSR